MYSLLCYSDMTRTCLMEMCTFAFELERCHYYKGSCWFCRLHLFLLLRVLRGDCSLFSGFAIWSLTVHAVMVFFLFLSREGMSIVLCNSDV